MIKDIFGTIFGGVVSLFKGNQEIKAAKVAGKIAMLQAKANAAIAESEAKINIAKNGQANEFDLDRIAMKNMNRSWKDELVLVIFLVPMIMSFIPSLADYALTGFSVIGTMPEWYRYIIVGMVVVIYGMRGMLTKVLNTSKFFETSPRVKTAGK